MTFLGRFHFIYSTVNRFLSITISKFLYGSIEKVIHGTNRIAGLKAFHSSTLVAFGNIATPSEFRNSMACAALPAMFNWLTVLVRVVNFTSPTNLEVINW